MSVNVRRNGVLVATKTNVRHTFILENMQKCLLYDSLDGEMRVNPNRVQRGRAREENHQQEKISKHRVDVVAGMEFYRLP